MTLQKVELSGEINKKNLEKSTKIALKKHKKW